MFEIGRINRTNTNNNRYIKNGIMFCLASMQVVVASCDAAVGKRNYFMRIEFCCCF